MSEFGTPEKNPRHRLNDDTNSPAKKENKEYQNLLSQSKITGLGNLIPSVENGWQAKSFKVILGRDSIFSYKIEFDSNFLPFDWRLYYIVEEGGKKINEETLKVLNFYFIALNDASIQSGILTYLANAYFYTWKSVSLGGTGDEGIGKMSALVFNPIKGQMVPFSKYISGRGFQIIEGEILSDIKNASNGTFLMDKYEMKSTLSKATFDKALKYAEKFGGYVDNLKILYKSTEGKDEPSALKSEEDIKSLEDIKTGVDSANLGIGAANLGIADVKSTVVSTSDLLKKQTQLFTPEELKDPKVQQQLKERAQTEAKLEDEKKKQAALLSFELGKSGVFDPLLDSIASESVSDYKNKMKNLGSQMVTQNTNSAISSSLNRPAKISPLELIKNKNFNDGVIKRGVGRPKGSGKSAKVNAFLELRSLNRIKNNFHNVIETDTNFKNMKDKPANFTIMNPLLAGKPVKDIEKIDPKYKSIEPQMPPEDRKAILRAMLFGE